MKVLPYLVAIRRPGIVHHDIQTRKPLIGELEQGLPVGILGHVCFVELAFQFPGGLLPDVFGEVCDDDFGALLLELGRDTLAETAAAAGDDGDFAVEFSLGHFFWFRRVGWGLVVVDLMRCCVAIDLGEVEGVGRSSLDLTNDQWNETESTSTYRSSHATTI